MSDPTDNRRSKVRSSALLLGGFALALYVGYIVLAVVKAGR